MSRSNSLGDFDVITGPPAKSRSLPPANPPRPAAATARPPLAEPATASGDAGAETRH